MFEQHNTEKRAVTETETGLLTEGAKDMPREKDFSAGSP